MVSCKGSIRDFAVIVIVTIATLIVLHHFLSFRSSHQDSAHSQLMSSSRSSNRQPLITRADYISKVQPVSSTLVPTVVPTVQPTIAVTTSLIPKLISLHKPVTSDVRGNLGPPEVVTNEIVADWLKDRWQAAVDMSGRPIPGEHWLEVDLKAVYTVTSILIDWEDGFSHNWKLQGRVYPTDKWRDIYEGTPSMKKTVTKRHIIHSVEIPEGLYQKFRYVRLLIHKPATQWGVSVWRFQIWGY